MLGGEKGWLSIHSAGISSLYLTKCHRAYLAGSADGSVFTLWSPCMGGCSQESIKSRERATSESQAATATATYTWGSNEILYRPESKGFHRDLTVIVCSLQTCEIKYDGLLHIVSFFLRIHMFHWTSFYSCIISRDCVALSYKSWNSIMCTSSGHSSVVLWNFGVLDQV